MYGALAVGMAGHPVGLHADLPVVALAVYRASVLGSVGVGKGSSATLYDGRHERLEARSGLTTSKFVGAALVAVAPAAPALAEHLGRRIEEVFAPEWPARRRVYPLGGRPSRQCRRRS